MSLVTFHSFIGGRKSAAVVAKNDKGKDSGGQMNLLPVKVASLFFPG